MEVRVRRPNLDRCLKGKHDFSSWDTKQEIDEFYRWRCRTCGAWMWRSDLNGHTVNVLRERKPKDLIRWEFSQDQDREARRQLAELRAPAAISAAAAGSTGVDSRRSQGVRSARSRGVHSKVRL